MKTNFKLLAVAAFLGLFLFSCSNDDDDLNADINPQRFENIEIGNLDFKVPQLNVDLHTVFDYTGNSKVKKIYYDIKPVNVSNPSSGEIRWQVLDHLVPEDYYEGQINPHVHYHIYFDPNNLLSPALRPAKGIYSLKITVIEEDNSESSITKEFEIVKNFSNVEVGHDNEVDAGSDDLHIEFDYDAGNNKVDEVKFELWFEEWRDGQNVPAGSWDNIVVTLPKNLYENQSKSHIHTHMAINPDFPVGDYWLNIYVKETGGGQPFKLSVPFSIH
ncbi:hypothetical protein [Confluentibacter lentus]|uniref:hypothetical protein n=1 Tax=Confluentibacter lentus TaxID=1699412 RepID=UPI0012FDD810|nr:hypothetical protein [Confluentibacter lentus]